MRLISTIFSVMLLTAALSGCSGDRQQTADDGADTSKSVVKSAPAIKKTILFFGNSLTAGYGLDDPSQAFSGIIQKRIDSLALPYHVVNAGVSGETTSGGNSRIDWVLKNHLDIFVLELGGNDGLRGIPVTETRKNLQSIIDKVKAKYPDAQVILAGMQMPPSMGNSYVSDFKKVYKEIAEKNQIKLIPFLLEGVGGDLRLNQKDGIHPTAAGHKIVADNVWAVLKDIL